MSNLTVIYRTFLEEKKNDEKNQKKYDKIGIKPKKERKIC
jgi:hypothetical protein